MTHPRTKASPLRAKLIFNPGSGSTGKSPVQLMEILKEMQAWKLVPEIFLIEPNCDLGAIVRDGLRRGFRLFVACGGDGTIDSVATFLAGTEGVLGILPAGTQNNVALSLGIPDNLLGAVALLRSGKRVKVDLGVAECDGVERNFLEICSVGLLSSLFPAADDIQHGKLMRIGDLLAALASTAPAEMRLAMEDRPVLNTQAHVLLAANMPFTGPHFQVASANSYQDGLLDVMVFDNLSKIELLGSVVQLASGLPEDPRIRHYLVRSLDVHTQPSMPVLADGFPVGEGRVRLSVRKQALEVIAGK